MAEAVFQFVSMLRVASPQKYIYNEIQTIDDNEFRFQEPVSWFINTPMDNSFTPCFILRLHHMVAVVKVCLAQLMNVKRLLTNRSSQLRL